MKILHIHTSFSCGGIEAFISDLANEMVKTDDVSVCSILRPKMNDIFWSRFSPKIIKFSLDKLKPGFSISEIFKIYSLINKEKYNVVNLHGYFYYYALAILLLHKKVNFFYTVHSDAKMENEGWDKYFFIDRLLINRNILNHIVNYFFISFCI